MSRAIVIDNKKLMREVRGALIKIRNSLVKSIEQSGHYIKSYQFPKVDGALGAVPKLLSFNPLPMPLPQLIGDYNGMHESANMKPVIPEMINVENGQPSEKPGLDIPAGIDFSKNEGVHAEHKNMEKEELHDLLSFLEHSGRNVADISRLQSGAVKITLDDYFSSKNMKEPELIPARR